VAKRAKRLHWTRRGVQILSAAALNPAFFTFKEICIPVLNCWGCPVASLSCPVGALGQMLALGLVPFMVLGTFIIFGVTVGRLLCGWACPFGLLQELVGRQPFRRLRLPSFFACGRYLALVFLVIIAALLWGDGTGDRPPRSVANHVFFCNSCPAGALTAALPSDYILRVEVARASGEPAPALKGARVVWSRIVGAWKFWIMVAIFALCVLFPRFFCRAICPVAAILGIFNRISFYRYRFSQEKCIDCKICQKVCPTRHDPSVSPNGPDCIRCLECREQCPTGALGKYARLQCPRGS